MKELLQEKGLWIASLICLIAMLIGFPFYKIELPLTTGSFLNFYQTTLDTQLLLFLIPIVAVLPVGAIYVRESSSGFLKLYITRISRMQYIKEKTLQIYAGGFLPFFLAGLFAEILCFLFLYPLELQGTISLESMQTAFAHLLRISLIGGIMAEISGIFAAIFRNYYMAYGLPFVCYYMLIILKERYLPDMYTMYPGEWIAVKQHWGTQGTGIWIFLVVFSLVVMLLNGLLLYTRLQEI